MPKQKSKTDEQVRKEAMERMAKKRANPDKRAVEQKANRERIARIRKNQNSAFQDDFPIEKPKTKSDEQKRKEARERMAKIRANPIKKAAELKANRERIAEKRRGSYSTELEQKGNPDLLDQQAETYRTKEKEKDAESHRRARQNPLFRTPEKKKDAEYHRKVRENPLFRTPEKNRDAEYHRQARENPAFRTPEKNRDAEYHRQARENPAFRTPEKERDAEYHRQARENSAFRTPEKERDAEYHRQIRENPAFRTPEKERDAQYHRQARENPAFRSPEKERDANYHRQARENSLFRTPEKERDTEAKRQVRKCPVRRLADQLLDTERQQKKRKINRSDYQYLFGKYNEKIRCAPSFICSCCGGLFYEESTSVISEDILLAKGFPSEFSKNILHVSQNVHRLCSTCRTSVIQKRIPRLSLSNGFDFPVVPLPLQNLSPLEERLVSLRLPFMQIRLLGSERQSVLRGNVVNVENDLDICAQVLPRKFNETSTVQVQLMRRMRYKSPYMYETIRPLKVYQAAKFLINSELYINEGVLLSDDWSKHQEGDKMNFICPGNESLTDDFESAIDRDNDDSAQNDNDNKANTEEEADNYEDNDRQNVGADETLIFREDDLRFCGIRIAPGEGQFPIPLHRDLLAEVLTFPSIYCGMDRKFKENLKISYTDIAKSELRRYDRRASNPTKVLYSFKKSFNEKVYQAVQICMRKKVGTNRLTVGNVRTPGYIENLIKKDEGYAVFKNIRSSPSYWKEKTKKVLAMVRQVGKCTFFITLSAAETKWTELLVMLTKIIRKKDITEEQAALLPYEEKADLIRSDPVTCMRHFDHRFRALLNLLFKPEGGIFNPYGLQDYFSRLEFQMRGSPHAHGLYWIKEAPEYVEGDEQKEKDCITFIDKFITCERCEEGQMEKLIGYQIHKHSHTCNKRQKHGKCRFGYPKPPMQSTRILTPLPKDYDQKLRKQATELYSKIQDKLNEMGRGYKENIPYNDFLDSLNTNNEDYILAVRSSVKRTSVFLKRDTSAIFVNPYNRQLLEAWGANIDIQFVLDTYACAKYCVGYILKSEGGVSKLLQAATMDARTGNKTIPHKLKNFANILINGTEISAQEAVAFLLGIPNTVCSRQDVFINTAVPEERIGFLKSKGELDDMDDESEEVCAKGLLDHYSQRPVALEHICLAEFASMYEFTKRKKVKSVPVNNEENIEDLDGTENDSCTLLPEDTAPQSLQLMDSSGKLKLRCTRKIIRFRHYGKNEDPKNYHREQLMLFLPWRNEREELLSINSIEKAEIHADEIRVNSKPFYYNHAIDDEALINVMNEMEAEENDLPDGISRVDIVETDDYTSMGLYSDISEKRVEQFLPPRIIDEKEYIQIMRTLNEKQRRFVLNTLHVLKTSTVPFYIFLSGGAGVGKSHALTAIVQSYLRIHARLPSITPEQICVLVSAPTGKAAFNVFGMTLHCTFKLPPTQYGGKVCNLDDGAVNSLRLKLGKTNLFIIDEISMVSVKQLYDIDQRLRQIFSTTEDFGGKSMIVVGHLRQLPPVAGTFVFKPPKHLPLGECVGNHLWEKFQLYELDEIMRQKGEIEFCKALNNMSEGCMDNDDIALIASRQISQTNVPPVNAIRLFRTNAECQLFNSEVHKMLKTRGATSTARDSIQGKGTEKQKQTLLEYAKTLTQQQSDGLPYKTHLQEEGEYFVSTNIEVLDGLFNGSTGCLKKIEYGTDHESKEVPKRAWMDFRNPLIGINKRLITKAYQKSHKINLNWVAIDRIRRNLSNTGRHKGLEIIRTQIPLVAANGMTIAKSQGSSMPLVVVNVKPFHGRKISRELLYVACSRATSRNGLYIDGEFCPPDPPGTDDPVTIEMERLRKNPLSFSIRFLQDYDSEYTKLYFHNVQSFVAHHVDVARDQNAMASDIIALVEPHLINTDQFELLNFTCIHRTNCVRIRNSQGALVFVKTALLSQQKVLKVRKYKGPPGHCIFVILRMSNVNIVVVYKAPMYSRVLFVENVVEILGSISGNIVFIGDININLMEREGKALIDLLSCHQLQPVLSTRKASTDGGTHIDCCFSNIQNIDAWFYESYYSYHKPICATWPKDVV